jgi:hypothetical protein
MPDLIKKYLSHALIILTCCIPPTGFLFFHWDIIQIFLFYCAELVIYELFMLPRIVIFVFISDEYFLECIVKKIGITLAWIIYHVMMFYFTVMFLIHTAFAVSAVTAEFDYQIVVSFIQNNILPITLIFLGTIYDFVFNFIKRSEYEHIPSGIQMKEIAVFYLVVLVVIALIHVVSVALEIQGGIYRTIMLFVVVGGKTLAQLALKKVKDKYCLKKS